MHWLTDKGCQYADKCRFTHPVLDYKMAVVSTVPERGKGHSRKECPAGKRSEYSGIREAKRKIPRRQNHQGASKISRTTWEHGKGPAGGQDKMEPGNRMDQARLPTGAEVGRNCHTSPTTRNHRRDQERGAGHSGTGSRGHATLSESREPLRGLVEGGRRPRG